MSTPSFPNSFSPAQPFKYLLWSIILCALAGPFLQKMGFPLPYYLALSKPALSSGFVWTLLTYPFVYPASRLGDFILRLGIDLALLWVFGNYCLQRTGSKRFFILFFGSVFLAGLVAAGSLFLFHPSSLAGLSPPLLALFTAWLLFQSDRANPLLKPTWIFLFFAIGNLFLDALSHLWVVLLADSSSILFGYLFCLISEKMSSPFAFLRSFEKSVLRAIERSRTAKQPVSLKVIDFKTGEPILNDDQFMDAMLARISLYGEEILTSEEKQRMQKISEQKAGKKRPD